MHPQPVPSLLYHDISAEPKPGLERFSVTPQMFREHLRIIRDSGRRAVTIGEWSQQLIGGRCDSNAVVLSLDDGFASWPTVAEDLAEMGLAAASMYVTSDYIGRPGYMSETALRSLPDWVEIGAHSVTHRRLDELPDRLTRWEISESCGRVSSLAGRAVTSFAYPHGKYSSAVRRAVQDLGLPSAAGVKNAHTHAEDDHLAVARWTVTAATDAAELENVLRGGLVPLAWKSERVRTKLSRYARRVRCGSCFQ